MSHRHLMGSDIQFEYVDGRSVLRGATLDIAPGSRVALLGANGSGKSTLLQCLAGTLTPRGGEVSVDGVPTRWTRRGLREHRQTVQLVFQDPDDQLFSASVAEDVAYGPVNLGLGEVEVLERVDDALRRLGVEHLRERPTHHLSFGERKRVAIAGAIAMKPCALLLDEPTAGMDPAGIEELFDALNRLERTGTTVAISTHDTALALDWADSVAVMCNGSVRQGRPLELLSDTDLLDAARLRPPWLITLTRELIKDGMLLSDAAVATSEELREALSFAQGLQSSS